jgi:hypothetical protein
MVLSDRKLQTIDKLFSDSSDLTLFSLDKKQIIRDLLDTVMYLKDQIYLLEEHLTPEIQIDDHYEE